MMGGGNSKMRVLMIDPVGTHSPAQYTHGLCSGLSKLDGYQVTLFTNYYYYPFLNRTIYPVQNIFYRRSENRKRSLYRNIVRGIEYIIAYIRILFLLKDNPFDVIHIQ
jgi:hypothetical protein